MEPAPLLLFLPLPPQPTEIPCLSPLCSCIPRGLLHSTLPSVAPQVRGGCQHKPGSKVQLLGHFSVEQRIGRHRRRPGALRWCHAAFPTLTTPQCWLPQRVPAWRLEWAHGFIVPLLLRSNSGTCRTNMLLSVWCTGCEAACLLPLPPALPHNPSSLLLQFKKAYDCTVSGTNVYGGQSMVAVIANGNALRPAPLRIAHAADCDHRSHLLIATFSAVPCSERYSKPPDPACVHS